jgi:hypothetical protein
MVARAFEAGKLYKDDFFEIEAVDNIGIVNQIGKVLDRLDLEIPADPQGYSGTSPSSGNRARVFMPGPAPVELAHRRGVDRLRAALQCSRRGRLLLGKVEQHHREVRRLLAGVRRIGVAWRELQGAAFFNHCLRSLREPGHRIPTSINGVSRDHAAGLLLPLFVEHASPALRRDIERYRAWAVSTLLLVAALDEVPSAVARPWPS